MVPKGLVKRLEELEIRGRIETMEITALLRSPRILETWGELLSLSLQWKTICKRWCEKLAGSNNNNSNNNLKKNDQCFYSRTGVKSKILKLQLHSTRTVNHNFTTIVWWKMKSTVSCRGFLDFTSCCYNLSLERIKWIYFGANTWISIRFSYSTICLFPSTSICLFFIRYITSNYFYHLGMLGYFFLTSHLVIGDLPMLAFTFYR